MRFSALSDLRCRPTDAAPHTLPLFTAEAVAVTRPRYGIRLVRESQIIYTKNITGAEMVVDLCHTIGLQERASEELHVFYLNTKNDVIGMELVSKGTLNASLVHPREVYKGALLANANSIMFVHNHLNLLYFHGLGEKSYLQSKEI